MDSPSSPASPSSASPPSAEVLQPRAEAAAPSPTPAAGTPATAAQSKKLRQRGYRPSHRATFIGLAAVMGIIAINAIIIGLVLKNQAKSHDLAAKGQVSISTADLNQLGINRSNLGTSNVQLTVAPDTQFKGKVSVEGDTTISGPTNLNGKLTGTSATLTQLQAGNTSLAQLNVNGDGTLSTLNLRKDLVVAGITQLQGAVTLSQLLTVNNSANVIGNLSVGGVLSAKSFSFQTLTVNGHIISSGSNPGIGPGGGSLGSNGSVSISGNDSAGRIAVNIGAGGNGSGLLANVAFRTQYTSAPHVVVSPIGFSCSLYVSNISVAGFSVGSSACLSAGNSLGIDYIVEQ
jgi:cytoskeletal protein CcmA (bactofilin family)